MTMIDRRRLISAGALTGMAAATSPMAAAQEVPPWPTPSLIGALPNRSRVSLDGQWKLILDPFDVSGRKPGVRRNFWEDRPTTDDGPLVEYEWTSSDEIAVPGDWNTQRPELFHYEGPAYHRRDIEGPSPDGRRRFLVFEAVNYRGRVWLNGEAIAEHEGGFTPFEVEVTDRLRPGPNSLVVRADSRHGPVTLPALDFDWKNHGGITRSVWLVDLPRTFVRDVFVRLQDRRIVVDIELDGPEAAGAVVRFTVANHGLAVEAMTGPDGRARLSVAVPRRLRPWSPETPHLHAVTVEAVGDRWSDRVGFRTIEARGREILLNGRPRFLKGIAMHEERIGAEGGRVRTEAEARALLAEVKALGCDFVRLAHYPHGEATLRLADEMGLIVWSEIPVYWEDVAYNSSATLGLGRRMMAEMITRDRNRCSVGFWSVANETPQTPERLVFLRSVIEDVRRLDPTRLVTAALNKNVDVGGVRDGETRLVVADELGRDLDVVAMNQYEGWYGQRTPAEIHQVTFGTTWDKPLLMSEFGADALHGHRGARESRWTEEHQAWLYEETLKAIAASGAFAGVTPWLLKDFRSPRRWHGRFQRGWNRKGVIDEHGRRKLSFDTLRAFNEAL
ncbi:glycoside hydrolase family 2 protein [Brevundimonas bacteroides]|uniref:glycoside hydrolase family 2 protein n=1 Tax=Brevundimonas bacteroides TaxID=74311 RepID=UPI000689627D|nr:glycoside hydrolase family 2 TIM barrel-domain containing protein [Brevundimonas bacteroides]